MLKPLTRVKAPFHLIAVITLAACNDPIIPPDEIIPFAASGVAAGASATCAWDVSHRPYCWGNAYEAAGEPKRISNGPLFAFSAAGDRFCGISAGAAYCWGVAPTGDGGSTFTTRPVRVALEMNEVVGSVAVGSSHACTLARADMTLMQLSCWGRLAWLDADSLAIIPKRFASTPPIDSFFSVTAGDGHSCALDGQGRAYCWGLNTSFALGRVGGGSAVPTPVNTNLRFRSIQTAGFRSCAFTESREIWCWGDNRKGQLGDGTTTSTPTPVKVIGLVSVFSYAIGPNHSCAISEERPRRTRCWGANDHGQIGTLPLPYSSSAVVVPNVTEFDAVTLGESHTCGMVSITGDTYCWGDNTHGQSGARQRLSRVGVTRLAAARVAQ